MERLSFENNQYDGLEASIHIARYLMSRNACNGKKVLDIACGEGYGSRLMKDWGAAEVHGVDISKEAVDHAVKNFSSEGIFFHHASAEEPFECLEGHRFDLIVSLETIEHVREPEVFLENLKALLNPGGVIIISCPNDWWYFPDENDSNPYHLRKYHFNEFQEQTEKILGKASAWLLGAPTFGYLNTILDVCPEERAGAGQKTMMQSVGMGNVHMVPAENEVGPRASNASYFVGAWGNISAEAIQSAALLPLSMDSLQKGMFQGHMASIKAERQEFALKEKGYQEQLETLHVANSNLNETLRRLRSEISDVRSANMCPEKMQRDLRLQLQAALAENKLMQEGLSRLQQELHVIRTGHDRYVRLRSVIPSPLRSVVARTVRSLRKR